MQKWLKSNEWRSIWVHRAFKIEIQKGGPNNSDILQNWFPSEIRSPLLNLQKFENPDRSTSESYKIHWKLINGEEFGSKKKLKLKYRRGDQIIETFCKIGSAHFWTMRKFFLIHAGWTEIYWMTKNFGA